MELMQEVDIILIDFPQSDGSYKSRPALILKQLPKYNDFLVCGISAQISQYIHDFDEIINEHDAHFYETGLRTTPLIRLFFLAVAQNERIAGKNFHNLSGSRT